jgi:hypothetical protein
VYLPAGKGLYPKRVGGRKGSAWKITLQRWRKNGATVHLIVTLPNKKAKDLWWPLVKECAPDFHVHLLDRELANAEDRADIERLDTFHPVLLVNSSGDSRPGAMWIERDHPVDSIHAYNVEYVAPQDAKTDERFDKFRCMYERLLRGRHATTVGAPVGMDQAA